MKYVFTTDGRAKFVADSGKDVTYSLELIEISIGRRYRSKQLTLFGQSGSVLYERKLEGSWKPIEPEKHLEPLWEVLYGDLKSQLR